MRRTSVMNGILAFPTRLPYTSTKTEARLVRCYNFPSEIRRNMMSSKLYLYEFKMPPLGGGDLPYETDGDARRLA